MKWLVINQWIELNYFLNTFRRRGEFVEVPIAAYGIITLNWDHFKSWQNQIFWKEIMKTAPAVDSFVVYSSLYYYQFWFELWKRYSIYLGSEMTEFPLRLMALREFDCCRYYCSIFIVFVFQTSAAYDYWPNGNPIDVVNRNGTDPQTCSWKCYQKKCGSGRMLRLFLLLLITEFQRWLKADCEILIHLFYKSMIWKIIKNLHEAPHWRRNIFKLQYGANGSNWPNHSYVTMTLIHDDDAIRIHLNSLLLSDASKSTWIELFLFWFLTRSSSRLIIESIIE